MTSSIEYWNEPVFFYPLCYKSPGIQVSESSFDHKLQQTIFGDCLNEVYRSDLIAIYIQTLLS